MIPEGHLLIVIDLVYTAPTDRIEPHRAAHMAFIKQCLDEGFILVSGPKVPRTGGTIIAIAKDVEAARARMALDPFVTENLVDLTYTPFDPGTRHPALP